MSEQDPLTEELLLFVRDSQFAVGGKSLYVEICQLRAEVARLRLALKVIGVIPDDQGHTYLVEMGDDQPVYARGVLAGADPLPVSQAVREGELE